MKLYLCNLLLEISVKNRSDRRNYCDTLGNKDHIMIGGYSWHKSPWVKLNISSVFYWKCVKLHLSYISNYDRPICFALLIDLSFDVCWFINRLFKVSPSPPRSAHLGTMFESWPWCLRHFQLAFRLTASSYLSKRVQANSSSSPQPQTASNSCRVATNLRRSALWALVVPAGGRPTHTSAKGYLSETSWTERHTLILGH